jgi:tetratricopeptide (TPR) repeat protein
LGELFKNNPGNNEIAAFYSIALIGSVPVGRNKEVYEQAAEIAKEVLKSNPKHPGALHYLIHAYDDPEHAAMALTTADKYSVVAPSAGHALHMPTHIYLSLGMWDKVVSSNIVSWEAGQQRKQRKSLTNDALNYHAYHWLEYGFLQKGDYENARKILDSMNFFNKGLSSGRAREHMIYQKSTYLAETNEYGTDVNAITVKQNDLNIVTRAMDHFANGMNFYHKKDEAGLSKLITKFTGEILLDEERITNTGTKLCGSINAELPNSLDIEQSTVMLLELNAMKAWLKKDKLQTEKFLKKAVEMEIKVSYAFGPPTIVKPSFEMYGEWLLENNRHKEALAQFELSLKAAPNKLLSMKGKAKAEELLKSYSTASL